MLRPLSVTGGFIAVAASIIGSPALAGGPVDPLAPTGTLLGRFQAPSGIRVATFNVSLNRFNQGDLLADLAGGQDPQARAVAEIIQRSRPDVLLLNEFDEERGRMQQSAEAMAREVEQAAMRVAELDAEKVEQVTGAEEQLALVQAEARRAAEEVASMEAEKKEADHEVEKLRARIEALQHESTSRASALQDAHQERDTLEERHQKAIEMHDEMRDASKSAAAEIDKRRRAHAKERSAWAAKVDSLKRAVGREHELHKAAVAQGEANKKKAKREVAKLKQQVKLLMTQLQQRQADGERHRLGSLDANVAGSGVGTVGVGQQRDTKLGHVSDADSGGFSDADGGRR